MRLAEKLRNTELKAKEKSSRLAKEFMDDITLVTELGENIELFSEVEKGILMEALEYATNVDPEVVEPVLDVVLECLGSEAPKVKWEAARVIGNISHRFPDRVQRSIPKLLENSKHKGIVVRWSAAFALGEIMKHDPRSRPRLVSEIGKILKKEKNNGVKNVYLRALKVVQRDAVA